MKSACSILFYLSLPCPTLKMLISKKFLSQSIIIFRGSVVQSGVSGVMESKAIIDNPDTVKIINLKGFDSEYRNNYRCIVCNHREYLSDLLAEWEKSIAT